MPLPQSPSNFAPKNAMKLCPGGARGIITALLPVLPVRLCAAVPGPPVQAHQPPPCCAMSDRAARRLAQHHAHLHPRTASSHASSTTTAATASSAAKVAVRFEPSVFAGTLGVPGTAGDGGQAADALVNNPFGVIRGPDRCACLSLSAVVASSFIPTLRRPHCS